MKSEASLGVGSAFGPRTRFFADYAVRARNHRVTHKASRPVNHGYHSPLISSFLLFYLHTKQTQAIHIESGKQARPNHQWSLETSCLTFTESSFKPVRSVARL